MKKSGFTLIELLVVIAIIAILAAVMLPVLNKARNSAQDVACRNNLSQIGKAIMLYSNDFAENYCWASNSTQTLVDGHASYSYNWFELYTPYTEGGEAFVDPRQKMYNFPGYTQVGLTSERRDTYKCDYEINWYLMTTIVAQVPYSDSTVAAQCGRFAYETPWFFMPNWSHSVKLGDSISTQLGTFATSSDGGPNKTPSGGSPGWSGFKLEWLERGELVHGAGLNYLFVDGHVSWLAPATQKRDWHMASLERHWELKRTDLEEE